MGHPSQKCLKIYVLLSNNVRGKSGISLNRVIHCIYNIECPVIMNINKTYTSKIISLQTNIDLSTFYC